MGNVMSNKAPIEVPYGPIGQSISPSRYTMGHQPCGSRNNFYSETSHHTHGRSSDMDDAMSKNQLFWNVSGRLGVFVTVLRTDRDGASIKRVSPIT